MIQIHFGEIVVKTDKYAYICNSSSNFTIDITRAVLGWGACSSSGVRNENKYDRFEVKYLKKKQKQQQHLMEL